jgi:putative ABC transport system permease protein
MQLSQVPLAWRNLVVNKQRLMRSLAGIAFAVLLMMVELGLRDGFIESMLLAMKQLNGDIFLVSSAKYQFDRRAVFPRRELYRARAVRGVASAGPFYETKAAWKNPQSRRRVAAQVFAFDPDQPVFLLSEINDRRDELRQPYAVTVDRRSRSSLGRPTTGTETELSGHKISVVGTFWLGPNFFADGTLVMSDWSFSKLFGGGYSNLGVLPDIAVGVVKVLPGHNVSDVLMALTAAMPTSVRAFTKDELIAKEAAFHSSVSPVGPVFLIGTLVGFAVGMLISYQILFSEIFDLQSQYATLKAMGYHTGFLIRIVLQQAVFYAFAGYLPAWLLCSLIFKVLGDFVLMPLSMSLSLTAITLVLTVGMCVGSALIAVRRVIATDPAALF